LSETAEMDTKKKKVQMEEQDRISGSYEETPRSEIISKDGESARYHQDKQTDDLTRELDELKQLYRETGESEPEILQQIEEIERELGNVSSSRGPQPERQDATQKTSSMVSESDSRSSHTPAGTPHESSALPVHPPVAPGGGGHYPNPMMPPYPQYPTPYSSGLPDEMLEQIHQQLRQTDDLLRRHAHENEELEGKVEDLLTRDGMDKKRRKEAGEFQ
jgi:hypothetical protein